MKNMCIFEKLGSWMCSVGFSDSEFGYFDYRNFCFFVCYFFSRVYVVRVMFVYCSRDVFCIIFVFEWIVDGEFVVVFMFFYSEFVWVFGMLI